MDEGDGIMKWIKVTAVGTKEIEREEQPFKVVGEEEEQSYEEVVMELWINFDKVECMRPVDEEEHDREDGIKTMLSFGMKQMLIKESVEEILNKIKEME